MAILNITNFNPTEIYDFCSEFCDNVKSLHNVGRWRRSCISKFYRFINEFYCLEE